MTAAMADTEHVQGFPSSRKRWTSEPVMSRSVSVISLSVSWSPPHALHAFGSTTIHKRKSMKGKGGTTKSTTETKHGFGGSHSSKKGPSVETVNKLVEENSVAISLKYSQLYMKHPIRRNPGIFPAIEETSPFDSQEDLRGVGQLSPARSLSADMERRTSVDGIPAFKHTQYLSHFLRGVYPNSLSVDEMVTNIDEEGNTKGEISATYPEQSKVSGEDQLLSSSCDQKELFPDSSNKSEEPAHRSLAIPLRAGGSSDSTSTHSSHEQFGADSDLDDSVQSDELLRTFAVDNNNVIRNSDILADLDDLEQFEMIVPHGSKAKSVTADVGNIETSPRVRQRGEKGDAPRPGHRESSLSSTGLRKRTESPVYAEVNTVNVSGIMDNTSNNKDNASNNKDNASNNKDNAKSELFGSIEERKTSLSSNVIQRSKNVVDTEGNEDGDKYEDLDTTDLFGEYKVAESPDSLRTKEELAGASSKLSDSMESEKLKSLDESKKHNAQLNARDEYKNIMIPEFLDKGLINESDRSFDSNESELDKNLANIEEVLLSSLPEEDFQSGVHPPKLSDSLTDLNKNKPFFREVEFGKAFDTSSTVSFDGSDEFNHEYVPLTVRHGEAVSTDMRYNSVDDITAL